MHIDIHQFKIINITVRERLLTNQMKNQKGTVVMELRPSTPINSKWAAVQTGTHLPILHVSSADVGVSMPGLFRDVSTY